MERRNPFLLRDPAPLHPTGDTPLEVALIRGGAIESRHRVHAVVMGKKGETHFRWGDPTLSFYPRSTVKLLQAAAWVKHGIDRDFGLGPEHLAIACGSHHGEEAHTSLVEAWLGKLGLKEDDLECGAHAPYHAPTAQALVREGKTPTQLHNNCSGKHSGLLTLCRARGWETQGYSFYDHPVQQALRETLGDFYGAEMDKALWGIDGCGIPTYSVSLRALATSMAHAADPRNLDRGLGEAVRALSAAIGSRPAFIGGTNSFCSQVVAETEGRVLAKVGAEGVYGAWIPHTGVGIAMKSEDGAARATEVAMAAVLRELGHPLGFFSSLVRRCTGEVVGQFICA
jgi:L-asparaginase II